MSIYTRAHDKGYEDYEQNVARDNCPFEHPDMRDAWRAGWNEARDHRFNCMCDDAIYGAGYQAGFLEGRKTAQIAADVEVEDNIKDLQNKISLLQLRNTHLINREQVYTDAIKRLQEK